MCVKVLKFAVKTLFLLFVCVGIVTGLALAVGTNITASTVATVVVDDTAGVEAGLPVVIEADLPVVIVAGNTKLNACYKHSCHQLTMLFVYCISIFDRAVFKLRFVISSKGKVWQSLG